MSSVVLFTKALIRRREMVFWMLAFPIFLLLIYGSIYGGGGEEQKIPVYVYMNTSSPVREVVTALNGTFELVQVRQIGDPVRFVLNETLRERRPATLVVVESSKVRIYSASPMWGQIVGGAVEGALYAMLYPHLSLPINVTLEIVGANATKASSLGLARLATMLMLVQAIGNGITGVAGIIAGLVASGYHKKVVLYKASRIKAALDVVASALVFSIISSFALLIVGEVVYKTGRIITNPHVWAAYLLNFFTFASVGLLLSNIMTQGRAAPQAIITISVMIFLTFAFISGYFIPLEVMPREMAQIALALPTSYTASYAYVAALGGAPTPDVLTYPIAATAALFTLGLLLFKPYKKP